MGVRLVVADDSVLVREGIAKVLSARGFEILAFAGDGETALAEVDRHRPQVLLTDIRMPPTGTDEGLRIAAAVQRSHPEVGVLVLSDYLEVEYATRLLASGTPGRGYLLKDSLTNLDAFAEAIRRVAAGELVVDPAIVQSVLAGRHHNPVADLSGRERATLELMAEGRSNAGIAAHLHLSERTVESHVTNVFNKLGLGNSSDDHRRVLAVLTYLRTH